MNVQGTFTGRATTDWPATCSLTAPTGSSEYPAVAQSALTLTIGPDPDGSGKTYASFMGTQASLGNPYFGSECSTNVSGEPDSELTAMKAVSPALFKRKTVTLRFAGSTSDDGIAYKWSTVIKLKRVSS